MSTRFQSIGYRMGVLRDDEASPSGLAQTEERTVHQENQDGRAPTRAMKNREGLNRLMELVGESGDHLEAISHELITPLNAIAGMAEVLADSSLAEEQEDQVRLIMAMGQELAANIEFALCRARRATGIGLDAGGDALGNRKTVGKKHPSSGTQEDGDARVSGALLSPETRVLVVDDAPVNREVATLLLRRSLKVQAEAAAGGAEALALLEKTTYDAVLMDCQMPLMDGYETTRRIRAGDGILDPQVPIIALTANTVKGHCAQCLQVGMDAYLNKPVRAEALKRILQDVLANR